MFELGLLDLDVKAKVETLFWQTAERMQKMARTLDPDEVPEDIGDLKSQLADQHICNFSVFQSLLDHWALGALFPIVPIHRLDEQPDLAEHARRHHLRLRRQGQQVHRPQRRARHAPAPPDHRRPLLPRRVPDRRLPGHHGRHAQPLRPRERGARLPR